MNRRVRTLYCEALREGGLLILVFASLDAAFEVGNLSRWGIAGWELIGFTILLMGIHLEPKG